MTVCFRTRKTKVKSEGYSKPRLPCFSKNMKINRCEEERQYSLLLKPSSKEAKVHNPPRKDTEGTSKPREKASPYSPCFQLLNTKHEFQKVAYPLNHK